MIISKSTEAEHTHPIQAIPISIDPVFALQWLIALFVVATLQAEPAKAEAATPERSGHEPFLLNDGHTYVKHAGMTIEQGSTAASAANGPRRTDP